MNLSQIINAVQRQFGDESGAQITRSDIIRWANHGQVDIVRKTEALQIHAETDTLKDDGSYDLPTGYVRVRRVTFDGRKLERVELEELDDLVPDRDSNGESSTPVYYYMWGSRLFIYPAPARAGAGNLDVYYVKMPNELVGIMMYLRFLYICTKISLGFASVVPKNWTKRMEKLRK